MTLWFVLPVTGASLISQNISFSKFMGLNERKIEENLTQSTNWQNERYANNNNLTAC